MFSIPVERFGSWLYAVCAIYTAGRTDMPDFLPSHTRRAVLTMAGAGGLALTTRSLAARPGFVVPQVDRLTLQVVDDAATFGPFLENLDLPGLKVVRAGNGGPANMPRMLPRAVVGEFGLSILGDSAMGTSERRVLIDFGYSRETMLTNMQLLGIDPMTIDAAVLSHGHLDHYDEKALSVRPIIFKNHCYGCTAGAGSSCGGATS